MKGTTDMTAPGAGAIFGQIDGILNNSAGFQQVQDTQASLMSNLASTIEGLAPNFQGQQGNALQTAGERLNTAGQQLQQAFGEHSDMMKNNANLLTNKDTENAHMFGQVGSLT
jgi:uncharacterized protein YukE